MTKLLLDMKNVKQKILFDYLNICFYFLESEISNKSTATGDLCIKSAHDRSRKGEF